MPEARMSYNFLFYDRSAGEAEVRDAINGELTLLHEYDSWRTSWTHIVSLGVHAFNVQPPQPFDLFLYDAERGEAELHVTDKSGNITLFKRFTGLRTGWSEIIAGDFIFNNPWRPDLVFYDRSDGHAEIHSFDIDGDMVRR